MKLLLKISVHWFGLLIMTLCMGLSAINFYPLEILERRFMDKAASLPLNNNRHFQPAVIVEIDENSISKLGSWPWPRSHFSSLIQQLSNAKAKTIAIDVLFEKKENYRIIQELQNINDTFTTLIQEPSDHYTIFLNYLAEVESRVDHDKKFIESIAQAGNVILPIHFKLNQFIPDFNQQLPVTQMVDPLDLPLTHQVEQVFSPLTANAVSMPFSEINAAAAGLGHINVCPDIDGNIREHTLSIMYQNKYYPSLPLRAVIHYLGLQQKDLEILPPNGLRAGNRYFETDKKISVFIKPQSFHVPKYSFYDVLKGLVPDRVFKDRIVIVGGKSSLLNLTDYRNVSEKYSHPDYQASVIENLLSNTTTTRPEWSRYTELAIMVLFGIFITFILPRNGVIAGILFTFVFIGVWTVGCVIILSTENLWLKWTYPCVELILGMLIIIPRQIFVTEKMVSPMLQTMIQRHPRTHKTLDQYEVEEELGRGMLGVVYRANDLENKRWVAIKTIQINAGRTSEKLENAKQQFIREALAACRLRHSRIVEVYDVGIENDICYVVMEYLDGGNALDTHFTRSTLLPLRKVLHYVIQICDALSYAHQKWIIHGGIKPSNIFLIRKDMIKVSDFGIDPFAKAIGNQTGEMLITPGYMSPEQVEGKKIDGRSDLFSLGILLYHLITAELPFQGASLSELMYNISHQTPISPKSINPKIPTALELILIKALAKDPNERFQSAESFGRHLRVLDEKIAIAVNKKRKRS
ncbi:MAG: CHASE2 domain-containing protein [Candidatus Magnetomorum sp.]|nr:CHASE2 domain-containing protein [Candidatus Magnetomorum sp.]